MDEPVILVGSGQLTSDLAKECKKRGIRVIESGEIQVDHVPIMPKFEIKPLPELPDINYHQTTKHANEPWRRKSKRERFR